MKKVGISDATRYFPPAHNDCSCFRLQGQEQTGTTQFSLADFSPGRPFDTIYFCIDGEITITDKDGNEIVLEAHDSIFIAGDEGRSIKNDTQYPASMMVILGTPKA
jgi:hypothetical protein